MPNGSHRILDRPARIATSLLACVGVVALARVGAARAVCNNPDGGPRRIATTTVGGPIQGLALSGTYAFVIHQSSLKTIEVSDLCAPRLIGGIPIDGAAQQIVVARNQVFATFYSAVEVFDIDAYGDLTSRQRIDVGQVSDITVAREMVYLAAGADLIVIDPHQPTAKVVSRTAVGAIVIGLQVVDAHAYLATIAGLVIVDVSDPLSPVRVGSFDIASMHRLLVDWPRLYSETRLYNGHTYFYYTQFIDVSEPHSPRLVETEPGPMPYSGGVSPTLFTVSGETVRLWDTSNPSSPSSRGVVDLSGGVAQATLARDLLFVAGEGFHVVDLGGRPSRFEVRPAWPNPTATASRLVLDAAAAGSVQLEIYDSRGRLIRRLFLVDLAPGRTFLSWDGRSDGGTLVASGVYLARFTWPGGSAATRVVRLR